MITTNFEPLDRLLALAERLLGHIPIPIYVYPAAIGAAVFLVWFWKSGLRKEVKLRETKTSKMPNADKYLGTGDGELDAERVGVEPPEEKASPTPQGISEDGEDLEGRLVNALAQAPWTVKAGSELALSKDAEKRWRIATEKIVFVLPSQGGSGTDKLATTPVPIPKENTMPPIPAEDKDEEGEESA